MYARITYDAVGDTTVFAIPFEYLEDEHVEVYVDDVQVAFGDLDFSTPGFVDLVAAYSAPELTGTEVLILRNSSQDTRLVEWVNGARLRDEDMNQDSLQAFYMAQEALDAAAAGGGGGGDEPLLTAHLADDTDAHDASAISVDASGFSNLAGDDVQEILAAVDAALSGVGATTFLALTDTPDAYTGHGEKLVAVKADESGLEFITGGAGVTDHGDLTGLTDDDHSQYALLAGRGNGQSLTGGTNASGSLTLRSTSNATKGVLQLQDTGGDIYLGGAATASKLVFREPSGSGSNVTTFICPALGADINYTLPTTDVNASLQSDGSGTLSFGSAARIGTYTAGSSTAVVFTGIPSWAKKIIVSCNGISLNGTAVLMLQLGDSGGAENSGYNWGNGLIQNSAASSTANATDGFRAVGANASNVHYVIWELTLIDPATNTWSCVMTGQFQNAGTFPYYGAGTKALSAALDRVSITQSGSDTFDAGNINIAYW